MSISKFKRNIKYSQFGEEGIIQEVIKRLKIGPSVAVEFGGADGYYCSNTALLRDQGWTVHMYDIHPGSDIVRPLTITPANVNLLPDCTILSIDCDGPDYEIWKSYKKKPAMVVIEINSGKDPNVDHYDPSTGANYSIMKKLGEEKGYFLLCHTGNLLFILNQYKGLFPDADETFIGNV